MRWLLVLIPVVAFADGDGILRETLDVGQTIERDVGWAIGYYCDDADIVHVGMRTREADDVNVVAFRGMKPGTTKCRIGTEPDRPTFVYELTVRTKRSQRPTAGPKS